MYLKTSDKTQTLTLISILVEASIGRISTKQAVHVSKRPRYAFHMRIPLKQIWPIENQDQYKVHFARWNKIKQPLDVMVEDFAEWQTWQEYRPNTDAFNREFVFALAQFYHEPETWMFGGIFRIVDRLPDRYVVELDCQGKEFISSLKLHTKYRSRTPRVNLESQIDRLSVVELLRQEYSGRPYPGASNIDISFGELETVIRLGRPDWQGALAETKGVYLITDIKTSMLYVGSAYGEGGVWSRWQNYIETGHGQNTALKELVQREGKDYCRQNFRFSILDHMLPGTLDDDVIRRETYWKQILRSRGEFGFNRN